MKRSILIVTAIALAMTFFAGHVLAQEATGLVNYGAKAGLNLANAGGADAKAPTGADKKFRIGLNAGFFVTYAFTDLLAIQPEVLYSMKGVKYKATSGDQTETEKVDYIEIPLLLKVSFRTGGNLKPSLLAGPYVGFKAGAKYSLGGTWPAGTPTSGDIKNVKSTDFGLAFGGEIGMKMTKGMPFLGVRYDLGLSKIDNSAVKRDIKTNVISIDLGYAFK